VKTLVASLQHFCESENPSCQPTTFLQQWRTVKTRAGGRRWNSSTASPTASLHHSTRFIARFIPLPPAYTILHGLLRISFPCHQPTPFYTVYCRMIYLDLSVQFKKVHDFLSFSHWKLRVFPRFSHGFFSPRQERTRLMYTGVYRNQRIKRCFGTVKSVFIGCYTASIYRISTATKL
jgi:hypothetical protein